MNNIRIVEIIAASAFAAAFVFTGCAKSEKTLPFEDEERYVEAWVSQKHPEATKTELGIYMLDDKAGDGEVFNSQKYVMVHCTVRDMDGNITTTNSKKLAQQLGKYEKSHYYGTSSWPTYRNSLPVGVEDMLKGMRVGGTRRALIPSWLMTTTRYKTPADYLKHSNDNSSAVYELTLAGITEDILKSQIDSMQIYGAKYLGGVDSLSWGFYYKQTKAPDDTVSFPSDTSIYINYTGRLLNRQVFDTTIKDTAKFYNIYSSSSNYAPVKISWGENFTDIKLYSSSSSDGSSVINGFSKTLWQMRKHEKGVGMFFSAYGYDYSGSGNTIPAYAPLVFEIEIVDKPEE